MILVSGAAGKTGRAVIRALAGRGAGVRAMVHRRNQIEAVRECGAHVPYTILQPAAYMQNVPSGWDQIAVEGIYRVPYAVETRLGMVDLEDVAEAAALALTERGHEGATYELAGPEALTQSEVATILSHGLGRPVRAETIPLDAWEREARAAGLGDYQEVREIWRTPAESTRTALRLWSRSAWSAARRSRATSSTLLGYRREAPEEENGFPEANFVSWLQNPGLGDALPVDVCSVRAAQVNHDELATLIDNLSVPGRNVRVRQHHIIPLNAAEGRLWFDEQDGLASGTLQCCGRNLGCGRSGRMRYRAGAGRRPVGGGSRRLKARAGTWREKAGRWHAGAGTWTWS